jgi:Domain of unknown function (DUF4262)
MCGECDIGSGRYADIGAVMNQVRANVRRHGWHATAVTETPPWVYTTGLAGTYGHPELLVAGLAPGTAHGLLSAAARLVRDGRRLEPGTDIARVARGFPVRAADVWRGSCRLSFGVADRYYGRPVPVRQILWPDPAGRFPGEPGCDPEMAAVQDIGRRDGNGG